VRDLESHYHRRGESILIEIKLNSVMQLFNSLDPSPFHEKDLDDDAEEYIVSTAREFALSTPLHLAIHLPPQAITPDAEKRVIGGTTTSLQEPGDRSRAAGHIAARAHESAHRPAVPVRPHQRAAIACHAQWRRTQRHLAGGAS